MRQIIFIFTFLSFSFHLSDESWSQAAPQKVKIAVSSRGIAFIDLYIAQDRGFFREEGLEAE